MKNGMHILIAILVVLTVLVLCALVKRVCKRYLQRKCKLMGKPQWNSDCGFQNNRGACPL